MKCFECYPDPDGFGENPGIVLCPLHAAASELLAACEKFMAWDNENKSPEVPEDVHGAIHDAIAKAKGAKP